MKSKTPPKSQLDVYVIDSGWDCTAHSVVSHSIDILKGTLNDHNLYVMTPEQSNTFLKRFPGFAGQDPILVVIDPSARKKKDPDGFGVAFVLGPKEILPESFRHPYGSKIHYESMVRMFCRIINGHDGQAHIASAFRKYCLREGLRGGIEILMESMGRKEHMQVSQL